MAAAKEETSPWMRRPRAIAAIHAIIFLHYGLLWVAVAGYVAMAAGRRFFSVDVDMAAVLSYPAVHYSLPYRIPLGFVSACLIANRRMWSVPTKDSDDKGTINKDPLKPVVIGGIVLLAFMMLVTAADFVVPLKGSQSVIRADPFWCLVALSVALFFIHLPNTAPKHEAMK